MANNLRDSNILQDFTVWIDGVGKIGEAPGFQPPELTIQTEEFRGGGMDGTVDIPMGVEKLSFDFDLHTWDTQVFQSLGYGPGSMDLPISFYGYLLTPSGGEQGVNIQTVGLLRSVKPGKVQAGQKVELNCEFTAHYYVHMVGGSMVNKIDVFRKIFVLNGDDRTANARTILGIN